MKLSIDKWSEHLKASVVAAHEETVNYQHKYVRPEHLLIGVLEVKDPCVETLLMDQGIHIGKARLQNLIRKTLRPGRMKYPALDIKVQITTPFSKKAIEIFLLAIMESKKHKESKIEPKHLLFAILQSNYRPIKKILKDIKI